MRNRSALLLVLMVLFFLIGQWFAIARGPGYENGEWPGYWDDHSIVIGEIAGLSDTEHHHAKIQLRPFGTLAGSFDPARTAELDVEVNFHFLTSAVRARPTQGDLVLAVLYEALPDEADEPGYSIPSSFVDFMPPPHAGLCMLDGLADQKIDNAQLAAQKARKKSDEKGPGPVFDWGDTNAFWRTHSVIDSDVRVLREGETPESPSTLTLFPKTLMAGLTDLDQTRELTVNVPPRLFAPEAKLPGEGTRIVVLLARAGKRYSVFTQRAKVMPGDHSPLCLVESTSKGETLKSVPLVESVGYWANHSLVYAKIKSIADAKQSETPREIVLLPKLTLSGEFDPATHPDLSVSAVSKLFTSQSPPGNGTMVIVLLVRSEKSYMVSPEPAEFMPGDGHQPICPVWDLSDHRVADALRAIRELRAKESASKR
jgi:hypothetical protein